MFEMSLMRRVLPAGAALFTLLACGALTSSAQATGYGQLASFGSKGTALGKFELMEHEVFAFGVDPADNHVFVGDAPNRHEYRIQELELEGEEEGTALGKTATFVPNRPLGLEGLAVNSTEHVVYALALYERGETSIDEGETVAGGLYAFKTEPQSKVLEPASGADEHGLLVDEAVMKSESDVQGAALLEPEGITFDPKTGDVLILGEEEPESAVYKMAIQAVHVSGPHKGELGPRYVNNTQCTPEQEVTEEEEGLVGDCLEAFELGPESNQPTSPVVSPSGRVYVEAYGGIWELPQESEFEDPAASPKLVSDYPTLLEPFQSPLVALPSSTFPEHGDGMSLGADGAKAGTLYAGASIREDEKTVEGHIEPGLLNAGALAFDWREDVGGSPSLSELGWTGGHGEAGERCDFGTKVAPLVAAGSDERLFTFDTTPEKPRVLEFGPGGTGCPTATASIPKAEIKGQEVTSVPVGSEVTLSSEVLQADALTVKWELQDGSEPTEVTEITEDEGLQTQLKHTFSTGGEYKIVENIHVDDLQDPSLKVERKLKVTGGSTTTTTTTTSSSSSTSTSTTTTTTTTTTPVTTTTTTTAPVTSTTTAPTTTTTTSTGGGSGMVTESAPEARIVGSTLKATPSGSVTVEISCASGPTTCEGTVTLATAGAVKASVAKTRKARVLTLGSGHFTLAGGQVAKVTVHISSAARKLLAKSGHLKIKATVLAHNPSGAARTTTALVTLQRR